MMRAWTLSLNAASTFAMAGLIWLVQLVHYPTFGYIDASTFGDFVRFHQHRISIVVIPLMLVELATTLLLLWKPHPVFTARLSLIAAACLALAWLSTFLLQVPLHQQLLRGADEACVASLAAGNWLRTGAWSMRALLLFFALHRCAGFATNAPTAMRARVA
jgi:hypothetical protein